MVVVVRGRGRGRRRGRRGRRRGRGGRRGGRGRWSAWWSWSWSTSWWCSTSWWWWASCCRRRRRAPTAAITPTSTIARTINAAMSHRCAGDIPPSSSSVWSGGWSSPPPPAPGCTGSRARRTGARRGHRDGRFGPSRRRSALARVAPHDRAGHRVVGGGLHRGAAVAAHGGTRLQRLAAHTAVAVRGRLQVRLPA